MFFCRSRTRYLLACNFPAFSAAGSFVALPAIGEAATVTNPICPTEFALFNPDTGSDIVVPPGFKVSVFATGLNFRRGSRSLAILKSSKCMCSSPDTACLASATSKVRPKLVVPSIRITRSRPTSWYSTKTGYRSANWPSRPGAAPRRPAASKQRGRGSTLRSNAAFKEGGSSRRLQSGDPRRWAKQQLTHRDRRPHDGEGHPVHHGAADR